MHGLMGAHACVGQYWMSDVFLSCPPHSFETGSLLETKAQLSDWLELQASGNGGLCPTGLTTEERQSPHFLCGF